MPKVVIESNRDFIDYVKYVALTAPSIIVDAFNEIPPIQRINLVAQLEALDEPR